MRLSVWGQITMPVTWLALSGLVIALSPSCEASTARLVRHKRDWEWNFMLVEEEKRGPPYTIGKLSSNKANNNTEYKIKGDGANTIFKVKDSGEVSVHMVLDRETKNTYKLTAQLIDKKTRQAVDKDEAFTIKITDINDNFPEFLPNLKGSIDERSPQGTKVLAATATDKDDPTSSNGQLEYKLLNGSEYFNIDTNGIITTRINYLDREKQNKYIILVHVKDMPGTAAGNSATTSVTINIGDVNDNMAVFKRASFTFNVKEDEKNNFKIGTLEIEDRDEEQNKNPVFTLSSYNDVFKIEKNLRKDGVLTLTKELDYETKNTYSFNVDISEDMHRPPVDNEADRWKTHTQITIKVVDVDEPPIFTKEFYNFTVKENVELNTRVGKVSATDPDGQKLAIRYYIQDPNAPVSINRNTGEMTVMKNLDREQIPIHEFYVTAEEVSAKGMKSNVKVNLVVLDVNDNEPHLTVLQTPFVCESDKSGTIIGTLGATDKDVQTARFSFSLLKPNANFSLIDNNDNTANITVTQGGFEQDDSQYVLEVVVSDNGIPPLNRTTAITISVCSCDANRKDYYCKAPVTRVASFHALIAIILCILIILIIVILFVLRRRYQKDTIVNLGKNSGEIHEQLVSYDEEGGGEMDTNGYDVSILTSARHDGSLLPSPGVYTVTKSTPMVRGNMAAMIEVKKDEADHDRDGVPYDTLHIYGYEGSESLAGSLSSLETSSDDSSLDYDFLNDWGPRFKTLAELYSTDGL